ncbi:hypothetical protein INR49_022931 [Caranx melampygus]|nr:hypothetical protein INR49_022931 [Caranx melampygus]
MKVKELYDGKVRPGVQAGGEGDEEGVAGKFIKAYSAKEKENVRQEIGIMNSLHHPKLVQCIDAFEGKSDIVMVLEMYVRTNHSHFCRLSCQSKSWK